MAKAESKKINYSVEDGTPKHTLLAFLYERKGEWVSNAKIFGEGLLFPKNKRHLPSRLYQKGLIDKKIVKGRAILKITEKGIDLIDAMEGKKDENGDSEARTDIIQIDPPARNQDRTRIMKFMFYEEAFSVNTAIVPNYIANKLNIPVEMVHHHLLKLVLDRAVLKNSKGGYYLTRTGTPIAEAGILGGREFTEDTIEAFIMNPIGRKVIHALKEGDTVNQIAERIGYNVESTFYDDTKHLHNEIEYGIKKTYLILDRLHRHGLIELSFHQHVDKSTRVEKIVRPDVIDILRTIAVFVEFIPTLLLEDQKHYSILRWLLHPDYRKKIESQLKIHFWEVNSAPEPLVRKVAYAERCAYWLNIDKFDEIIKNWRDVGVIFNKGRHYYMVRRRKKGCAGRDGGNNE